MKLHLNFNENFTKDFLSGDEKAYSVFKQTVTREEAQKLLSYGLIEPKIVEKIGKKKDLYIITFTQTNSFLIIFEGPYVHFKFMVRKSQVSIKQYDEKILELEFV
jgi:hypothetical protein